METLILALIISLLAILGLAVGVIFGRTPIKGSCGALACGKKLSCLGCQHRREQP